MANPPNVAPNVADQWQNSCSDIGKAFEHLFMNPIGADICFVPLLNASVPPKKFTAHKVVLLARSPVLAAQFHWDQVNKEKEEKNRKMVGSDENQQMEFEGVSASKKAKGNEIQEVELPDVEPEAFQEFLRFCYTDKAEINAENATSILYTANRYNALPLIALAVKFICENIKEENAFEMLDFAERFGYGAIKDVALGVIQSNTKEAVKAEAFLGIGQETLTLFASQNFLTIKEIQLFEALILWAMNRQTMNGNEGKTLRELLGQALFYVQFWRFHIADFARLVVPTKVLTDAETVFVYNKLGTDDVDTFFSDPECPFFKTNRGSRLLTLDLTNAREFANSANTETKLEKYGEPVYIDGFTFRILALCRKTPRRADIPLPQEGTFGTGLGFFVQCIGEGADWSCNASATLSIVSKKAGQENLVRLILHRFHPAEDDWGFSHFFTFDALLDPENGWVEDDTVTLKARVKIERE